MSLVGEQQSDVIGSDCYQCQVRHRKVPIHNTTMQQLWRVAVFPVLQSSNSTQRSNESADYLCRAQHERTVLPALHHKTGLGTEACWSISDHKSTPSVSMCNS